MSLRVAMPQINTTVGDIDGNAAKVVEWARKAAGEGADLVIFPELTLTGYPPEDLLLKEHFVAETEKTMAAVVAELKDIPITIIIGSVCTIPNEQQDNQNPPIFNSLVVAKDGKIIAVYNKMLLPNYGVFDENRYFFSGNKPLTCIVNDTKVALTICEDIWYSDSPALAQSNDADLIINISASPYHKGKGMVRQEMLVERARTHNAYVALCALVGGQDELVFDGQSLAIDPQGTLIARGKQFEEDLVMFSIPESDEASITQVAPQLDTVAEIYEALKLGVHDYVTKNGFERVVLGLSGGIDSALTACIAVDALGAEQVTCIVMPSPYSSHETQEDARLLSYTLGTETIEMPITKEMDAYEEMLAHEFSGTSPGIAEENIQARIRGNLIMALSNKFGWLPLATGNKSEYSVGYTTLYGDMSGGFAVLKDLPKTLVYALSRYCNEEKVIIPESIIDRVPSAELKPGQTDQEKLPPYDVLDPILEAYVEEDKGFDEIVMQGFDAKIVELIISMVDRTEYKRRQAPPGIKITPKAFGRDRRIPITNRFSG